MEQQLQAAERDKAALALQARRPREAERQRLRGRLAQAEREGVLWTQRESGKQAAQLLQAGQSARRMLTQASCRPIETRRLPLLSPALPLSSTPTDSRERASLKIKIQALSVY